MRKLLLFMVIMLITLWAVPVFAGEGEEMEVGFSMTPLSLVMNEEDRGEDYVEPGADSVYGDEETDLLDEFLVGLHFGYSMGFLYASLDSFIMPPFMVQEMTSGDYYDEEKEEWYFIPGIERPGFLNFIDVGIKITLSNFVLFGEIGINNLYVYNQGDLPDDQRERIGTLGTNLRVGASYKVIDNLSVGLTGTAIFPNFKTMGAALKGLLGDENYEGSKEQLQLLPMIMVVLYL